MSQSIQITNPEEGAAKFTTGNRARRHIKKGVAVWVVEGRSIRLVKETPEVQAHRHRKLVIPSFFWPAEMKIISAEQARAHDKAIDLWPTVPQYGYRKKQLKPIKRRATENDTITGNTSASETGNS